MPLTDPDSVYFTAKQVRVRFGNVSDVTLHRWLKDPAKEFPRPIYIGERRYWKLADIEAFEERLRTNGRPPKARGYPPKARGQQTTAGAE